MNALLYRTNLLWLGVSLLALFLVVHNSGLYPSVFSDEYTYSKFSRLLPLSVATHPDYLYLKLFSATNYCGDGFLGCARVFNTVLFVLSAPFIFLTSRTVAGTRLSIAVTLLALAGPINTYTAYFMPESLYFLGFWVVCWLLTRLDADSPNLQWLVVVGAYGASALIKPHSILFLPAILLYIAWLFYSARSLLSLRTLIAAISFVLGAAIIKFAVGYLLAGEAGLTLFGHLYGGIATSTGADASRYLDVLSRAFVSLFGHLSAIAIIYGVPLAVTIAVLVGAFFQDPGARHLEGSRNPQLEKLCFLALAIFLNLGFVAALYTASVDCCCFRYWRGSSSAEQAYKFTCSLRCRCSCLSLTTT